MLYNWPKACPLYAQAEALFAQAGDRKDELCAKLGRIRAQIDTGVTPKLDNNIEEDLHNPLIQGDARLMLRLLTTKAAMDQETNEASARDLWERVLDVAKRINDKRWEARAQAELGVITFLDGDIATATEMLKSALLSSLLHGDFGALITYGSIVGNGQVEVGQPQAGLKTCSLALKIAAVTADIGFPYMAYEGKARALIALHREQEAKTVLERSIAQARVQGARAAEAQLLVVAGKQAAAANDPTHAIEYLKSATSLCETGGFPHVLAWSTLELAKIYRDMGDLENAEEFGTESLNAMRQVKDKYHLPYHFTLLADLETKKGNFPAADELYDEAAEVVESLLVNVPTRQLESTLIAMESQLYLGHFNLAASKLYDVTRAYQILERARGRSMTAALRGEPLNTTKPDSMIQAAQKEVNGIQIALLRQTNRTERRTLLDRLFQAEQILAPVGSPNNHLQVATIRNRAASLSNVRMSLRPDEMILEYVLDEPLSFCLRIARREAGITVLPAGRKQIEDLVEKYLTQVASSQCDVSIGKELYRLLVRPIAGAGSKRRLVIVPDGKLHLLPFDSLRDLRGNLLLNYHIVTYAPSASALYLIRTSRPVRRPSLTFLGLGGVQDAATSVASEIKSGLAAGPSSLEDRSPLNPFDLRGSRLQNIPVTHDEVVDAAEILGGETSLLLGRNATEAALKAQPLARFQIIHIATHGIASPDFPDRASLILGSDPHSNEDGLLQDREIKELGLNADLVTLSGCDTGIGQLQGEEGIANLVRAFLFAGAKSVVASLWTASDICTCRLMRQFYWYLKQGNDNGQALRRAKIDLIDEFGADAVPFYWAGFVIVGDGSHRIPGIREDRP